MIRPGLLSVTFRKLQPSEIVALAVDAGLGGIEWGGDVHVPHGDLRVAREIGGLTADAGLATPCYGSYYRLADDSGKSPQWDAVRDSALALGTPLIRVWAGGRGSADAKDADYGKVAEEALRVADDAAGHGLKVALEYHDNTLTDSRASAIRLLKLAEHPALRTLWQPPNGAAFGECAGSLEEVLDRLENLHVFSWNKLPDGSIERLALVAGEECWRQYLRIADKAEGDRWALLEFVRNDDPAQMLEDAAVLRRWLAGN
jgi:sugar phosphate isomerase/epimerase